MHVKWDKNAKIRKSQIESGIDLTFCNVFVPIMIDEISTIQPNSMLEIGSGTGHLAKLLYAYTNKYTAIEPSKGMFEISKEVLGNCNVRLENCVLSELVHTDLFDCALSHMVAHVVENIDAFFSDIASRLDSKGIFIFSIPHPVFYNGYKGVFKSGYSYIKESSTSFSFKISLDSTNPISEIPYHHRPISRYINAISESGFRIINMNEIYPELSIQELYGELWNDPRYCIFKCEKI